MSVLEDSAAAGGNTAEPTPDISQLSDDEVIALSLPHNWVQVRLLGEGSFGSVNLVRHNARPQLEAAMKIVKIPNVDPSIPARHCTDPNNEWKEMSKLDHPHIVRCLRAWRDENTQQLYILLEYVPGEDLQRCIKRLPAHDYMDGDTIGGIFVQLLSALWYMSQHGMCHRDLKPENILLSWRNDGKVVAKIIDFGFARTIPPSGIDLDVKLSHCGTWPYMAPERLRKEPYNCPSDIWSLGLILVEMITKQHLFKKCQQSVNKLKEEQYYARDWLRQTLPHDYGSLTDLILGMLEIEPSMRWTPDRISQHEWVQMYMEETGIALAMPGSPSSQAPERGTELSDL